MYQTNKLYVIPTLKVSELILENPSLLILMEHFDIDIVVHEHNVHELCDKYGIPENIFILFANFYNGFFPSTLPDFKKDEITWMIRFLANSHIYYKTEKYPEIKSYISELTNLNTNPEIKLIQKFFNEYFEEVIEHLDYENNVAFPFFTSLLFPEKVQLKTEKFSAKEYKEHHTDIEYKLRELKNLLLKHISIQNDRQIRRKLLVSLFELENDLKIHSIIEETVLTPLMRKIELKK